MARPRAARYADWSGLPNRDDRLKYSVQVTDLNVAVFAPRIHEGMDWGAVGPGKLLGKRTPANEPVTLQIA